MWSHLSHLRAVVCVQRSLARFPSIYIQQMCEQWPHVLFICLDVLADLLVATWLDSLLKIIATLFIMCLESSRLVRYFVELFHWIGMNCWNLIPFQSVRSYSCWFERKLQSLSEIANGMNAQRDHNFVEKSLTNCISFKIYSIYLVLTFLAFGIIWIDW